MSGVRRHSRAGGRPCRPRQGPAAAHGAWSGLGLVLAAAILGCADTNPEHRTYVEALMHHRSRIDAYMMSDEGPLTEAQRGRFKGLAFYTPRVDLVFDVTLQKSTSADTVRFITSDGTYDEYLRLGTLEFEFEGRTHELTLFRSVAGGTLFLPFSDLTAGDETYGAGRYLDPQPLGAERYRLDFNHAYNPYCAYNSKWVCPLPPPENILDFAVRAGERDFPYGHE